MKSNLDKIAKPNAKFKRILKFRYFEKATKIRPIFHFLFDVTQGQIAAAFSEYLNFTFYLQLQSYTYIPRKYYKHSNKGAHQSHLGRQKMGWSHKCFNPYFLDQPVRIFVNGLKISNQYV